MILQVVLLEMAWKVNDKQGEEPVVSISDNIKINETKKGVAFPGLLAIPFSASDTDQGFNSLLMRLNFIKGDEVKTRLAGKIEFV